MKEKNNIEILNDEKYNVEVAKDVTIPTITSEIIEVDDERKSPKIKPFDN